MIGPSLEQALLIALAENAPLERRAVAAWLEATPQAEPMARIVPGFVLDPAEAALIAVLHCAGLSEPVAAAIHGQTRDNRRGLPLWLAQRLLPDLAAQSLSAGASLRRFALIECECDTPRIDARLWLTEALADRLGGMATRDPAIAARFTPLLADPDLASPALAAELAEALRSAPERNLPPLIQAIGLEPQVAAAAFARLGLKATLLRSSDIPADPEARERLATSWSRESAIDGAALVIEVEDGSGPLTAGFAERVVGHVLLTGQPLLLRCNRALWSLATVASRSSELERWHMALGPRRAAVLGPGLAQVAGQFRLSAAEIETVAVRTAPVIDRAGTAPEATRALWHQAARAHVPSSLPGVTIAEPRYTWDDIVLPPPLEAALRRIESHVRHAALVFDQWGFDRAMGGRGRGVAALFSGPSGTGKTMAAEVLAAALDLRLMTIDLSQVISKYIGETSKNIAAAFAAAERTGAVMVWNEGDAIWGSRGEVGHATDRLVNAEVGDLLQRIEAFGGFTVVTTNLAHAIDPAFQRRFRFALDFPLPGRAERIRLWQRAFPAGAPLEASNWQALAGLQLSGGAIRSVALGAAFLAAEAGGTITPDLITREIAEELRKQGLPMPRIDWGTAPQAVEAAE